MGGSQRLAGLALVGNLSAGVPAVIERLRGGLELDIGLGVDRVEASFRSAIEHLYRTHDDFGGLVVLAAL